MNNMFKMRSLTSLVFTTVIAIGLFSGISIAPNIDDIFAEKYKEGKSSNNDGSTSITISLKKDSTEKCTPWDPRGC
jgi:hypothetical protein